MAPPSSGIPHLYSSKLYLRPLIALDEARYVSLFTDPEIMEHVGSPMGKIDAASAFSATLGMMSKSPPDAWLWIACDRTGGQEVGLFGLVMREGRYEIGAMVLEEHQGRGFAYEALSCVRDFGFAQLRLAAQFGRQLASNRRSVGLMLKLGFEQVPDGPRSVHWQLDRAVWASRLR